MRKLLILMLVLGMASLANASLIISVHETDGSPYDGRTLNFSDELWLDIESVGGDTGDSYWGLVADIDKATIDPTSGVVLIPSAPDASMLLGSLADNWAPAIAGREGIMGTVGAFTAQPPYADGTYFDEILFHCEGNGPVTIDLLEFDGFGWVWTGVTFDSVVIPQIPEPATMLLLGLGGLLLRRRK